MLFPPVSDAEEDGLLAVGGDLSPERLLGAYECGLFPWFSDDQPILWWAPNPRFVLYPEKLKVSKSMNQVMRNKGFSVTYDQNFEEIIRKCSKAKRNDQDGTWITNEMIEAYGTLHKIGVAHSVEVWLEGKIVGGLYGVSLGKMFFGESMFADVSNASKVGFISLVRNLIKQNFELIDCQVYTPHLESLGAENIDREEFMLHLDKSLQLETLLGNWNEKLN